MIYYGIFWWVFVDNSMKFYVGAFLTGLGVILIYESIALRLIDAILFLGILLLIIGAILLLSAFLEEYYGYRLSKEFSNIAEYKSRYIDGRDYAIKSNIKDSFLGSSGLNSNYYETPVLCPYGVREERSKASFFGPTRQEAENREYRRPVKSPKRKQNSRPVLRTRPSFVDEKKSAHNKENRFRTPSKKYVESDNKHHVLRVRKDYDENKGIPSLKDLNFTPNYEKPMRITRRPRRKSPDKIDINNIPQRVQDSKSLEDKISFLGLDESQLLEPPRERTFEEIAEDVIVPIHTSEDDVIIPIYNDTNYNVTYAGYDYETDMVEYGYTNSIQEPVHVVEVYDSFEFDPSLLEFVKQQTANAKKPILFIYGEDDPWTGACIDDEYINGDNVRKYIIPAQTHTACINLMQDSDNDLKEELLDFIDKALIPQSTAISNISADDANSDIYDLNGSRLKDVPERGIFVQKGKKVIK